MPIWPAEIARPKEVDSHGGKKQRRLSLKSRNGSDAESQATPPHDEKEARLHVVQASEPSKPTLFVISHHLECPEESGLC